MASTSIPRLVKLRIGGVTRCDTPFGLLTKAARVFSCVVSTPASVAARSVELGVEQACSRDCTVQLCPSSPPRSALRRAAGSLRLRDTGHGTARFSTITGERAPEAGIRLDTPLPILVASATAMADVMDMVENALATEDGEDDLAEEDFDAVPMPDFFAPVRQVVCDEDGELRTWIKALRWVHRLPWPIVLVGMPFVLTGLDFVTIPLLIEVEKEVTAKKVVNQLSLFADLSMGLMFSLFARQLHKAIKLGGTLEQMGAGTQLCSARVVRNLTRLRNVLAVSVAALVAIALGWVIVWAQFPLMVLGILEWPETMGNNGDGANRDIVNEFQSLCSDARLVVIVRRNHVGSPSRFHVPAPDFTLIFWLLRSMHCGLVLLSQNRRRAGKGRCGCGASKYQRGFGARR